MGQGKSYGKTQSQGGGKYILPLLGRRRVTWQRAWMYKYNMGMFGELETSEPIYYNLLLQVLVLLLVLEQGLK